MHQETIKTDYYYELLTQIRGKKAVQESVIQTPPKTIEPPAKEGAVISNDNLTPLSPKQSSDFPPGQTIPVKTPLHPPKIKKRRNIFTQFMQLFAKTVNIYPLAKIVFKSGEHAGREFFLYNINPPENPAGYVKIGRSIPEGEQYFITINSPNVSRYHVKIVYMNGKLIIANYSEVNPAKVNGRKIPPKQSVFLPERAAVTVGDILFSVEKIETSRDK